jgi:hypothetical protein
MKRLAVIAVVIASGFVAANPSLANSRQSSPAGGKTTVATTTPTPIATAGTPALAPSVAAFDTTATINGTAFFQWMYARGFRLYIMHSTAWGTCTAWSQTQTQLKNALAAGLKVAVYTRDPTCWQGGIEAAGPYVSQLQFFAIDIETDPGIAATQAMVAGVESLGVRPVIYSGSGMWSAVQGFNDTSFANVPLWDTNVTGKVSSNTWIPDVTAPTPVAYGGWNTSANPRVMVQQAFNVTLDGVSVDLNSVDPAFLR